MELFDTWMEASPTRSKRAALIKRIVCISVVELLKCCVFGIPAISAPSHCKQLGDLMWLQWGDTQEESVPFTYCVFLVDRSELPSLSAP